MDLTLVIVGLTGVGKSATGNIILRREAFISGARGCRVTQTCKLQTGVLEDGQTISVIDTPGFLNKGSKLLLGEEFKKCMNLARNRIRAVLFVISLGHRFSKEDGIHTVGKLQRIFGENIINYIIPVFTREDAFWGVSFESGHRDIIDLCKGRYVYFYNETKDEVPKSKQVQKLLSEVKTVISHNDGKPFMSQELELQLQVESTVRDATTRLEQQLVEVHATTMNANKEQTTQIIDVVEARLGDTTTSLEQKMEVATLKTDERAEGYLSKSYEEQMTQRLEVVEQRVLDTATRLEQQLAEAHAAQMRVNEIGQQQITQRFNEEVEAKLRDTTTSLEQLMEAATLKADKRAEMYFKEETSELIQRISKSYEEQMTQRLEAAVEQRVLDMTTRLQQQLAEAYAAQMKVNKIARKQMKQRINEEVESRVKDVTTRLEQQLAEAEAARLKAHERAQEAQKKSDEHIQKLKEVLERAESRRSETISDFESSSFHVYDPSTYLLQSAIK